MKLASSIPLVLAACVLWLAGQAAAWSADPALARVISLSGEVKSGARALKVGDTASEGEEIVSGVEGRATLEFADRSLLRVRTSSRLRIEAHRSAGAPPAFETRLRLESGAVEATVAKQGAPRFSIASPLGNIAASGAHFRARARGDALLVEVVEGAVAVAGAAGGQVAVDAGHGIQVRPAEALLAPVKLLEAPDLSGMKALQQSPVVRIRFAPIAGAVRYRVVVAADRDLREVIVESRPRRPDMRVLELDDGEYFYGVRAIDALGLDGLEVRGSFHLKVSPIPTQAK
jgi:hypothetical protein